MKLTLTKLVGGEFVDWDGNHPRDCPTEFNVCLISITGHSVDGGAEVGDNSKSRSEEDNNVDLKHIKLIRWWRKCTVDFGRKELLQSHLLP